MSTKKRPKTRNRKSSSPVASTFKTRQFGVVDETMMVPLSLAVLVGVTFMPALWSDFLWDDSAFTSAEAVKEFAGIFNIWFHPTALVHEGHYWPLTYSTFWLQHMIWGFSELAFHAFNLFVHFLVSSLFWLLLRRLDIPGAWFAAALFAVHPIHVEPVVWVIGRKDLLASLFAIMAIFLWYRFATGTLRREWPYCLLSLLCYAALLVSKSTLLTLPIAFLILIWWKNGRIRRLEALSTLPFLAIGILYGVLDTRYYQSREVIDLGLTFLDHVLIASQSLWFYVGKLVLPTNLIVIYPHWDVNPQSALVWSMVAAVLAVPTILWFLRHRFGRAPVAVSAFFILCLSPVLGFVEFGYMQFSYVADRYLYFASAAPIALVAAGAVRFTGGVGTILKMAAASFILLILAAVSWNQATIYRSSKSFFSHIVDANPTARGASENLAHAHLRYREFEEALTAANLAIEIAPYAPSGYTAAASALFNLDRVEESASHLKTAEQIRPLEPAGLELFGIVSTRLGQFAEAAHYFEELETHLELNARTLLRRANAYVAIERYEDAESDITNALSSAGANDHLGSMHMVAARIDLANGDHEAALQHIDAAVAFDPSEDAHSMAAATHYELGNFEIAAYHLRELLKIAPENADYHADLGVMHVHLGEFEDAVIQFERALDFDPDHSSAAANLALAQQEISPE